jgi:hypothetical protein
MYVNNFLKTIIPLLARYGITAGREPASAMFPLTCLALFCSIKGN